MILDTLENFKEIKAELQWLKATIPEFPVEKVLVAGGAVLSTIIPGFPLNDIDVFVTLEQYNPSLDYLPLIFEIQEGSGNMSCKAQGHRIDLVFVHAVFDEDTTKFVSSDVNTILSSFDIGLSQFGIVDETLRGTRVAFKDLLDKKLTVVHQSKTTPERVKKYLARLGAEWSVREA